MIEKQYVARRTKKELKKILKTKPSALSYVTEKNRFDKFNSLLTTRCKEMEQLNVFQTSNVLDEFLRVAACHYASRQLDKLLGRKCTADQDKKFKDVYSERFARWGLQNEADYNKRIIGLDGKPLGG